MNPSSASLGIWPPPNCKVFVHQPPYLSYTLNYALVEPLTAQQNEISH